MTPAELRALIAASGLSVSRFARDVAGRNVRTVQRWLAGDVAIPASSAAWLRRIASIEATRATTTTTVTATPRRARPPGTRTRAAAPTAGAVRPERVTPPTTP